MLDLNILILNPNTDANFNSHAHNKITSPPHISVCIRCGLTINYSTINNHAIFCRDLIELFDIRLNNK